jgi:ABC-type uncharacterized transport system substrate-binding protein
MNKAVWSSILVAAMLLAVAGMADAQQQEKIRRIGFLSGASLNTGRVQAFGQGLPDLGYFEGKNIAIEYRLAEGKAERLPALAAELLRLQVAIIVTSSTAAVKTAQQATTEIPIVVASAGDLVGEGIVASLARPGGNITGLTAIAPDLSGKRLAILKESIPKATRFAVICGIAIRMMKKKSKRQRSQPRRCICSYSLCRFNRQMSFKTRMPQ